LVFNRTRLKFLARREGMGCGGSKPAEPAGGANMSNVKVQNEKEGMQNKLQNRDASTAALTTSLVQENKLPCSAIYDMDKMVELGRGGFGTVCIVEKKGTKEKYALKEMHGGDGDSGVLFEEMVAEINVQKSLDHPNVARVYDYFLPPKGATGENDHMYIVMELCAGGSILSRLSKTGVYSEQAAATAIEEVLHATAYCHQQGLVHRDIKLENFVYESTAPNARLKMIDFGFAAMLKSPEMAERCGTPSYMAPEAWISGRSCDAAVDMWAIGVLTYMLLSGTRPFHSKDLRKMKEIVTNAPLEFKSPRFQRVSKEGTEFCKALLQKDKKDRLTAVQALKHAWIVNKSTLHTGGNAEDDSALRKEIVANLKDFAAKDTMHQVAMETIAFATPPAKCEEFAKTFKAMDTDYSGTISIDEFRKAMEGNGLDKETADKLFKDIDMDGTGTLAYTEFLAAAMSNNSRQSKTTLKSAFAILDKDGNGQISKAELTQLLGSAYTEAEVDAMIKEHGGEDALVSYTEFQEMMINDMSTDRGIETMSRVTAMAAAQRNSTCGAASSP